MADKKIKIVRKDKMLAGYNGNLESVIVYNKNDEEVDTSNGVFVTVGELLEGHREVKKAVLADDSDIGEDVLFIHNPEVMYDERLYKLEDFYIKAGKVARAYRLFDGDIITFTEDLFAEEVSVGDVLAVKEDGLLGVADDPNGAKVVFEVIENCGHELHVNATSFAVQVKRN